MNTQRPFIDTRRPSQRYDFHRMPVEGSYAMRHSNDRRTAVAAAAVILVLVAVLLWVY